ncbi:RraA family protein [Serratia proteamaculans]|uniref:RraA family protein n=1 Tax=Serratia proteamaculans TaxID=28151 RepID=UPI0021BD7C19|nr:RraA family protein [Serratia proteamaculans]
MLSTNRFPYQWFAVAIFAMKITSPGSDAFPLFLFLLTCLTGGQYDILTCTDKEEWDMASTEKKLFDNIKENLSTALLGDILDEMGLHHQFLHPRLQPLADHMRIAGRAMPVLEADYATFPGTKSQGPLGDKAFGVMFEALDSLMENEVYIASGSSPTYALWGGLMSTRANHLKAAGAILNGYSRDKHEILALDFPVFSRGNYAQDQKVRGKVLDYRVPVNIDGVLIAPGDMVVADEEGVLVIPARVEQEVIGLALEKKAMENKVRDAIAQGMGAVEAYHRFGVM